MIGIIACAIAIGAITIMGAFRGRLAALTTTGVSTAIVALAVPPFLSFRVESSTDLAAVFLQGVIGLFIATRMPARSRRHRQPVIIRPAPANPPINRSYSLHSVTQTMMQRDPGLRTRIDDVHVYGNIGENVTLSESCLLEIVGDVLRIVFSHETVRRISIHTGRRPGVEQITIIAARDLVPALPRMYLLGRSDLQSKVLQMEHWPAQCSVTWFDNGYDYIYQISITKSGYPPESAPTM